MNNNARLQEYEKRITGFTELLKEKTIMINRVSTARLISALALLICLYFSFQQIIFLIPFFSLLIIFVLLVRWHSKLFYEKEHFENLVAINRGEIASLAGDFSNQPTGVEFIDPFHAYASDLDIFGESSLYQYLNRACTASGKEALAKALCTPLSSVSEVTMYQQAIQEISPRLDFRQNLQATSMHVRDTDTDRQQLRDWLKHSYVLYSSQAFRYLLVVLPLITISSIVVAFFFSVVKPLAILLVLTQWSITGFYNKRISVFHDFISRKKEVLEHYSRLLQVINKEKYESTLLTSIQSTTREASTNVTALASLVRALDARLNFMTSLVVNAVLLYDLQCVYRLEKWKAKNAHQLDAWLDAISTVEKLNSFATYAYTNDDYCYAKIESIISIQSDHLAHPLLKKEERVPNSVTLGNPQSVFVVTGANMAGKSTFLRTLGVNLILALNGAPVCAQSFSCPVIRLRTGMRATDSLKDHQSYFYAELNRLKTIVDDLKSGQPLFILLDEILKGTNSTDKLNGSMAMVKQLLHYPCLAVIATHDLALGSLAREFPNRVKNVHFEPTIEADQLSFDYLLKPGVAEKMNATFLMKKMGIIP